MELIILDEKSDFLERIKRSKGLIPYYDLFEAWSYIQTYGFKKNEWILITDIDTKKNIVYIITEIPKYKSNLEIKKIRYNKSNKQIEMYKDLKMYKNLLNNATFLFVNYNNLHKKIIFEEYITIYLNQDIEKRIMSLKTS